MLDGQIHEAVGAVRHAVAGLLHLFLSPSSIFSLYSLFSALCVAVGSVLLFRRNSQVKLAVMWRAFFPRRLVRSASARMDAAFLLLNVAIVAGLVTAASLSADLIGADINRRLVGLFGHLPKAGLALWAARAIVTVGLFLAYELAYWSNHWASHRVPFLWAFHRVHHTAEVLSPLTNARVHPVDSIVFANFVAVFSGVALGVMQFALGAPTPPFTVGNVNFLLIAFTYFTIHLQHSHFWIPATGWLGRVVMSPAHHQLHHSDDPAHHNTNFGSCLALWDWLFGTLVMPERKRQRLSFGAGPHLAHNHTLWGTLVTPFGAAGRTLGFAPVLPEERNAGAFAWRRRAPAADEAA